MRKRLSYHIIVLWLFALMAVALPLESGAASVSLSERLYKLYMQASKKASTDEGLVLADSMRRVAISEKSRGGELLALTIPVMNAYRNKKGIEALDKAIAPLQEKALEYHNPDYYYYAVSNKVYYLANENKFQTAVEYMKRVQQFAQKNAHPYGIYVGYNMLGHLHQQRGEYVQALKNYNMALDFCKLKLPELELESTYRQMCVCYRETLDFDGMLKFIDKELPICKNDGERAALTANRGLALFMLGDDKRFLENYETFKSYDKAYFSQYKQVAMAQDIFKDMLDGKKKEAYEAMEKMADTHDKTIVMMAYYQRNDEYYKAVESIRELYITHVKASRANIAVDIADLNAIIDKKVIMLDKERDDYKRSQLELANAQLKLNKTELEIERSKNANKMAQMESASDLLTLNNQKLISKRLKDSIKTQRYRREAKEREMQSRNTTLVSVLIFTLAFFALVYVFLRRSIHMSKRLKALNVQFQNTLEEISVAKDEALEADRMKTVFLRNMSHEIRTPLNSIVGFSQVLVDMEDQLEEEEKTDVMQRIASNSELLGALINDILDLTSIESGRYVMKAEDVPVNMAAQQSIDAVSHRNVEGVELRFVTDAPDDCIITSDMQRIMCVLTNFLTNAEKNTTHGSITLECSLAQNEGMVTFSVTDTGIGIPENAMEEVFERFKKLDTFKQGTGLGLFICRTIVEKLGGEIGIDRNYTEGARFWFTVPAVRNGEPINMEK